MHGILGLVSRHNESVEARPLLRLISTFRRRHAKFRPNLPSQVKVARALRVESWLIPPTSSSWPSAPRSPPRGPHGRSASCAAAARARARASWRASPPCRRPEDRATRRPSRARRSPVEESTSQQSNSLLLRQVPTYNTVRLCSLRDSKRSDAHVVESRRQRHASPMQRTPSDYSLRKRISADG